MMPGEGERDTLSGVCAEEPECMTENSLHIESQLVTCGRHELQVEAEIEGSGRHGQFGGPGVG